MLTNTIKVLIWTCRSKNCQKGCGQSVLLDVLRRACQKRHSLNMAQSIDYSKRIAFFQLRKHHGNVHQSPFKVGNIVPITTLLRGRICV
jgi:hypothetical protein